MSIYGDLNRKKLDALNLGVRRSSKARLMELRLIVRAR